MLNKYILILLFIFCFAVPLWAATPESVSNFTVTTEAASFRNFLRWTNPANADLEGVMIRYSKTAFPTSTTDANLLQTLSATPSAVANFTHSNLSDSTTYYYTIYAYDTTDPVPYYSPGRTAEARVSDITAPGAPSSFSITSEAEGGGLIFSWTKPSDSDLAGITIRKGVNTFPATTTEGTSIYSATGTTTKESNLTNGQKYYYSIYAFDEVPNYSSLATAEGTPRDTRAPSNALSLTITAEAGGTRLFLSWTNPAEADFLGVRVMRKRGGGYPASATDESASLIYQGTGTATIDANLTSTVTYYYKIFSYDEIPNYSSGASGSAIPGDQTAPAEVGSLNITTSEVIETNITVAWRNPADSDFAGVLLVRSLQTITWSPVRGSTYTLSQEVKSGVRIQYLGTAESLAQSGLSESESYHYKIFTYDSLKNYSSGSVASITIGARRPRQLRIESPPQYLEAGMASNPIRIGVRDGVGVVINVTRETTAYVTSESASGRFSSTQTGSFSSTLGVVTISAGSSEGRVYYKDTLAGTFNLIATAEALHSATKEVVVTESGQNPQMVSSVKFDGNLGYDGTVVSSRPVISVIANPAATGVGSSEVDLNSIRFYVDGQLMTDGRSPTRFYDGYDPATKTITYEVKSGLSTTVIHTIEVYYEDASNRVGSKVSVSGVRVFAAESKVEVEGDLLCYPAAFNPLQESVKISYILSRLSSVSILIYNIVAELVGQIECPEGALGSASGYNEVTWNGRNFSNEILPNGVYFIRLVSRERGGARFLKKGKVIILR